MIGEIIMHGDGSSRAGHLSACDSLAVEIDILFHYVARQILQGSFQAAHFEIFLGPLNKDSRLGLGKFPERLLPIFNPNVNLLLHTRVIARRTGLNQPLNLCFEL
jgi:hypothetical protein